MIEQDPMFRPVPADSVTGWSVGEWRKNARVLERNRQGRTGGALRHRAAEVTARAIGAGEVASHGGRGAAPAGVVHRRGSEEEIGRPGGHEVARSVGAHEEV